MSEVDTGVVMRLITGRKNDGRAVYDPQAKAEVVRACMRHGVSVAHMALQCGINANLLRRWITQSMGADMKALRHMNLHLAQGHDRHNSLVCAGRQTLRPELRYVAYMNIVPPELSDLFAQLGLPSDEVSIQKFIRAHLLPENVPLDQGRCWTSAQARFLRETLAQDADWALMIDRLNAAMHKSSD